ncbi:hypothetical protein NW768_006808 [Fusarium equiseti]|uniref:Uncharacterized protein n=1 Tax=Fusarium equiseti TaxID=61235 RepID=A0ABQ8R995_FUSEQ|nr:hypothetical protein NW768_006808 [Fusarium equiseti]
MSGETTSLALQKTLDRTSTRGNESDESGESDQYDGEDEGTEEETTANSKEHEAKEGSINVSSTNATDAELEHVIAAIAPADDSVLAAAVSAPVPFSPVEALVSPI